MSLKVGSEGRSEPKEGKQRSRKRPDRPLDAVASAKQSERAERRRPKKRKTMKRCTSPSHFAVEPEEEIKYGEDYTLDLPSRERIDTLLRSVSAFYYRSRESHPNQTSVWVDSEYDQTQYPSLDLILSPIRRVSARESWCSKEVAIFEAAMCKFPKEFGRIAKLIKTKTTQEVVKFYYTFWKHHAHYRIWKGGDSAPAPVASVKVVPASLSSGGRARPSPQPKKMNQSQTAATAASANAQPNTPAAAQPNARSSPQANGVGSTNPSSAAFSNIPPELIASRADSAHARIRMVDKNGRESFFILPSQVEHADGGEGEGEGGAASPSSANSSVGVGVGVRAGSSPSFAVDAGDSSSDAGDDVAAGAAADDADDVDIDAPEYNNRTPAKGYKCCLPSTTTSEATCGKFCRTTNALGSHLRMAHGIAKAGQSTDSKKYYIECVE